MRRVAVGLLLLPLAACTSGRKPPAPAPAPEAGAAEVSPLPVPPGPILAPPASAVLKGSVTYRQRSALTPEAVVQVELRETPRAGEEPTVVARRIVEHPGQVPIAFELAYDPSAIDPSRSYTVSARITDRGQLQFVTETPVPVLSAGTAAELEIVVTPVR